VGVVGKREKSVKSTKHTQDKQPPEEHKDEPSFWLLRWPAAHYVADPLAAFVNRRSTLHTQVALEQAPFYRLFGLSNLCWLNCNINKLERSEGGRWEVEGGRRAKDPGRRTQDAGRGPQLWATAWKIARKLNGNEMESLPI